MFSIDSLSQYCRPFAPSALPDFNATIGDSDFLACITLFLARRLVRSCTAPSARMPGSPWLPPILSVELDEVWDPGEVHKTRLVALHTMACGHSKALGPLH